MLKMTNITKKYGKEIIINQINLEVGNGVFALLAPNGFGKTTILSMIATINKPSAGIIEWEGKDIFQLNEKYRDILGYLPQKVGYYQNYTAVQNLQYIAALKGIKKKQANERIEELLEQFNLYEARNKKVKTYSGGMIQRLGIIGTLINKPKIILLDEPSAGLDPKERNNLKSILAHIGKSSCIIVSTHITSDIEFLANKIIMLKEGKILCENSAQKICEGLKGKIYETYIEQDHYAEFIAKYLLLDEQVSENGIKVKFYCDEKKNPHWQESLANLNDIFLYQYRKGNEDV